MHFEILIEDASGEKMLENLVPKIIDTQNNTFKIHSYKGCGSIPKGLKTVQDPSKRALLSQLPRLLSGYGKIQGFNLAVVVVCDLDDRNKDSFLQELKDVLANCNPAPKTNFCLAIEEGEAWLLGNWPAIKSAYPNAKEQIFKTYINDSICGTWEKLADVIYSGGHDSLKKSGTQAQGIAKSEWAEKITPKMNVNDNKSPSFNSFKAVLESYAE